MHSFTQPHTNTHTHRCPPSANLVLHCISVSNTDDNNQNHTDAFKLDIMILPKPARCRRAISVVMRAQALPHLCTDHHPPEPGSVCLSHWLPGDAIIGHLTMALAGNHHEVLHSTTPSPWSPGRTMGNQ